VKEGVSVIICSHNGASLLPDTLAHLKAQRPVPVPWEVLLVDNASTDDTSGTARSSWKDTTVPLRVVSEPRLGVRYAREKGFEEASYGLLAFVDDDNWVAPDWVAVVFDIMSNESRLGAVGSIRDPVFDGLAPGWFKSFHSSYAVLTEQDFRALDQPPEYLPTAGLCVRKSAWEELLRRGFSFRSVGRKGTRLTGGEDTELTMALRLSGWELRVDPKLRLRHFMPSQRLKWKYLRRLLRSYEASHVTLDSYSAHSLLLPRGPARWISESWLYQLGRSFALLSRNPRAVVTALALDAEGDADVIAVEKLFGRVLGLLQLRGRYRVFRRQVREADWLQVLPDTSSLTSPKPADLVQRV
jgi:glycosyltransferase involved in cell wall biosynthesis